MEFKKIETLSALEGIYDAPSSRSMEKVQSSITPLYQKWIEGSRFVILSTVGKNGTDASPRGDDGAVVEILDTKTVLLPDWRGNNRLDSLRNIVEDGRASLMFMINGEKNVVRMNGRAALSDDEKLISRFNQEGKTPKTVIVFTLDELYFQCAKSIMRSKLWEKNDLSVPSAGELLKEAIPDTDALEFDRNYPEYAKKIIWG